MIQSTKIKFTRVETLDKVELLDEARVWHVWREVNGGDVDNRDW